jgi:hypothetical protein
MKTPRYNKRSNLKSFVILFFILGILAGVVFVYKYKNQAYFYALENFNPGGPKYVEINYGEAIHSSALEFNINPSYLKALCMLESSGRKVIKPRFEKHVFEKLKLVKKGELQNYEHVTQNMLEDASEDALKNLASSWGPFQLMGYKCLLLDIKIADIRGEKSIYWGTKWIWQTYGSYLKQSKFKDAFHIHNTGKPFPKNGKARTYDPNYITNGLEYMNYFDTAIFIPNISEK